MPDPWRRVPCEQQLDSSESPDSCDGSPCFVFCCSSPCYDSTFTVNDVDTSLLCSTFRALSTQKEARSQTHVNDSNHFSLFDTECLQVVSSQSTKVCHSAGAVPLCQVGTLRVSSACWSKATSAREDRIDVWPCGRGFSSVILLIQKWWSSQIGTCGRLQRQTTVTPWHLCISPSVVSFKRNFLLFEIQTWWPWERDVLPKTLVDMSKSLAAGSRSLGMLLQRTFAGPCGGDPPPV